MSGARPVRRVVTGHDADGRAVILADDSAPPAAYPGQDAAFVSILSGRLELELDDGVTTLVGPGDIVVQRGTIHRWRNPSETEVCRGVMVLTEAERYRHDGVPLENVLP